MNQNPDHIERLIANEDTLGLLRLLRIHPDPDVRGQVASRLTDIGDGEIIEGLIRAYKLDADPGVKKSAWSTLEKLLGNNASQVIAAYGEIGEDEMEFENALRETQAGFTPESQEEDGEMNLSDGMLLSVDHTSALASIVSDDRHPERQIKALNILSNQPSLDGNNAITSAALWSENTLVRQHALSILKSIYGEELPAYLAEFKQSATDEEQLDELDLEQDEEEEAQEENQSADTSDYGSPNAIPSTFKEEKSFNGLQLILFILLIIIIVLLLQRFLLH